MQIGATFENYTEIARGYGGIAERVFYRKGQRNYELGVAVIFSTRSQWLDFYKCLSLTFRPLCVEDALGYFNLHLKWCADINKWTVFSTRGIKEPFQIKRLQTFQFDSYWAKNRPIYTGGLIHPYRV